MTKKTISKKVVRLAAYRDASPVERFKISKIAIKRWRKANRGREFKWAEFAALREQVAREMTRPPLWYRMLAGLHARLGKVLEKRKR